MRRLLLAVAAVAMTVLSLTAASSDAATAPSSAVTIIQAVPGAEVSVTVDGEPRGDAEVGDLLGPFDLSAGRHDVSFVGVGADGEDIAVDSTLTVEPGGTDVVLHLPAEVGGAPVVHSYRAPTGAIGPGKARVMLAHTATVAPADVEVDGQTVFTNIANGEFAEADVPAGTISVALLPSGTQEDPILGPVDVTLGSRTLSMIYAYGNPRDGSMNVIAHVTPLAADGSVAPTRIDTGSAGLVTRPVSSFGEDRPGPSTAPMLLAAASGWVLVAALVTRRRRSRSSGLR